MTARCSSSNTSVQRDGGGLDGARWFVLGEPDPDHFSAGEETRGAGDLAVYRDSLVGDQAGGLGSRERHLIGEKPVRAARSVHWRQ